MSMIGSPSSLTSYTIDAGSRRVKHRDGETYLTLGVTLRHIRHRVFTQQFAQLVRQLPNLICIEAPFRCSLCAGCERIKKGLEGCSRTSRLSVIGDCRVKEAERTFRAAFAHVYRRTCCSRERHRECRHKGPVSSMLGKRGRRTEELVLLQ